MSEISVNSIYVLTGGASRRFGTDKATFERDGEPWARRVVRELGFTLDQATVVTRPVIDAVARHETLGMRMIEDREAAPDGLGFGPVAGLQAALADLAERDSTGDSRCESARDSVRGERWAVLTSCDLVNPNPQWWRRLVSALDRPTASGFDVESDHESDHAHAETLDAVAYHDQIRWQPFPCLVNARWSRRLATELRGIRSMQAVFDRSRVLRVAWPAEGSAPRQANRPDDLG